MMDTLAGGIVTIEGPVGGRFLRTHLPVQAGQGGRAALHKNFGLDATSARVTARVRHDIDTTTSNSEIIGVGFRQGAGKCQSVFLAYRSNSVRLVQENPCESGNVPEIAVNLPRDGAFHRVDLSAVVGGMVEVLIDGTSVAKSNTATFVKMGQPGVFAGISYAGNNGAINVDVDDLVFVAQ
jgi:hypothetical protein